MGGQQNRFAKFHRAQVASRKLRVIQGAVKGLVKGKLGVGTEFFFRLTEVATER